MANEWSNKSLDALGRIVTGKTPPLTVADAFGGSIPFITPSDMDGTRIISAAARTLSATGQTAVKNAVIPKNAVMVSCIGSDMGKAAIAGANCITNQQINSIVIDTDDSPLFVYYNLSTRKSEIRGAASGSAQPILNKSAFGRLEIELPPPEEQRAIAHILGTLDDKIELNRKQNKTLEAIVRALFKAWFVDFEPVRAKMEGRWRRDQSLPGLPKQLYDIFPGQLIESEFGEIPEGWVPDQLATFTSIKNGYAFKSKDWRDCGVPVVKIGSVKPRFVDLRQASFIEDSLSQEKSQFRLRAGDMLVGLTGYVGETGRVPVVDVFPMLNQRVGKFEPKAEFAPFVFACVRAAEFKAFAESKAHGSAQPNVSTADLLTYPVINPGKNILAEFCNIIGPIFDQQLRCESESRSMAQLRDTLLPKLISGDLRVPDAEKIVGAMA